MQKEDTTILVVDDEADACIGIQNAIAKPGLEVCVVRDINQACNTLMQNRDLDNPDDRFAVAIVDLQFDNEKDRLPDWRTAGWRVVKEAIKDPFIEIIILTSTGGEDAAAIANERGAFRYVRKLSDNSGKTHFVYLREVVARAIETRRQLVNYDRDLVALGKEISGLAGAGEGDVERLVGNVWVLRQTYRRIVLLERSRCPDWPRDPARPD